MAFVIPSGWRDINASRQVTARSKIRAGKSNSDSLDALIDNDVIIRATRMRNIVTSFDTYNTPSTSFVDIFTEIPYQVSPDHATAGGSASRFQLAAIINNSGGATTTLRVILDDGTNTATLDTTTTSVSDVYSVVAHSKTFGGSPLVDDILVLVTVQLKASASTAEVKMIHLVEGDLISADL